MLQGPKYLFTKNDWWSHSVPSFKSHLFASFTSPAPVNSTVLYLIPIPFVCLVNISNLICQKGTSPNVFYSFFLSHSMLLLPSFQLLTLKLWSYLYLHYSSHTPQYHVILMAYPLKYTGVYLPCSNLGALSHAFCAGTFLGIDIAHIPSTSWS